MKISGDERRRRTRSTRSGTPCSTRAVLVATIPGCERLEATGDHAYAMTVTAGVAAIKGTYAGSCALSDLKEHESLVMKLQGAGAPGTVDATVDVGLRRRRRRAAPGSPTTPTRWSAAWSAASASGCSARCRSGWPASSSATSAARSRPRPPAASSRGRRRAAGADAGRAGRSSPRRPGPAASRRRTTSSRASSSAPGWCSLGVVAGGLRAAADAVRSPDRR